MLCHELAGMNWLKSEQVIAFNSAYRKFHCLSNMKYLRATDDIVTVQWHVFKCLNVLRCSHTV